MSSTLHVSRAIAIAAFGTVVMGCSEGPPASGAAASGSATSAPAATTTAASAATSAAATATAAPAPTRPCPAGSTGEGSLKSPCESKGNARMMEVTWTGKMTDGGPSFRVINKSALTILYGKILVYFYDKAGKQLEVKDSAGKGHPNQPCTGNLFSGVMKPGEKAVITFSCVKKDHVPEGAVAIEGEMQMVGFADDTEKKSDLFWRNNDLTPDTRAKGGVK